MSKHDKANDKKDLIINLNRRDDARQRNPIHFPRAFFINAVAKGIRTRESSRESGEAERRWPFNRRMLTPAANGMPIMFYAFFIFERWGRKGPEVGKMAEGKSQPKSSRTSIPSHRLGRRSFFFSLGVDRKIKFRCQRYKQELYVALRSQRPILRDHEMTTCSSDWFSLSVAISDYRDARVISSRAPLHRHHLATTPLWSTN